MACTVIKRRTGLGLDWISFPRTLLRMAVARGLCCHSAVFSVIITCYVTALMLAAMTGIQTQGMTLYTYHLCAWHEQYIPNSNNPVNKKSFWKKNEVHAIIMQTHLAFCPSTQISTSIPWGTSRSHSSTHTPALGIPPVTLWTCKTYFLITSYVLLLLLNFVAAIIIMLSEILTGIYNYTILWQSGPTLTLTVTLSVRFLSVLKTSTAALHY